MDTAIARENVETLPAVSVVARPLPLGDAEFPEHKLVLDYWNEVRNGGVGPRRSDLDPERLKAVLPRITLIERDAASGQFRFRLAGTSLYQLNNMEISRRPVDSLSPPAYVDMLTRHYQAVFDAGMPNAYRMVFRADDGLERWYATLRVPLSDDGRTVHGIMTLDNFCDRWEEMLPYIVGPNRST